MLKFILGKSKSGKTEYTRSYLESLARSGEDKLLMIVPDQMTFETEKAFLERLGPTLCNGVKVMGFSRLCDYVFEKCGYIPKVLASDSVKTLLMSIALEETSHSLKVYENSYNKPNIINMMLSVRYELLRNKSSIDNLKSDGFSQILRDKLSDVSLVLATFDALLSKSFEDPDGELSVCYDLLLSDPLFADYTICVDSFLSFSQLELDVLEVLLKQSKDMLVTFTDDGLNDPDSIFTVSRETVNKLRTIAKNSNIPIASPEFLIYDGYFKSQELRLLEENVFRILTADDEPVKVDEIPGCITVNYSKDVFDEADFVARNIKRLVMEEGYSYKDMAIICRDISPYRTILNTTLNNYNIPHFMDSPKNVLSSPLMKLVVAAFNCVTGRFQQDDVLSVIKSGLLPVDSVDMGLFENYIFTWSVNGSSFKKPFKANPSGLGSDFKDSDRKILSKVETVRQKTILPLLQFAESVRDATASQISEALYNLLMAFGVTDTISKLKNALENRGELRLSEEQSRIWDAFILTLDNTVDVMAERRISPATYCELLKLQFMNFDLAFIPKAQDEVTVGDIERLRLSEKKVVFIMGAVYGEFPRTAMSGGIFSPSERENLTEAGLLSDASVELEFTRERYHCYYALTSASEKLFVSYPVHSADGTENIKSEIIEEIYSIFTPLEECVEKKVSFPQDPLDFIWAKKPSFSIYAERLTGTDALTTALEEYYLQSEEYGDSVGALNRAYKHAPMRFQDPKNTDLIYGKNIRLSASRIDRFHECKFKYFCEYGLKIKSPEKAEFNPMEYGSYVHYILENFVKSYSKDELINLTEAEIDAKISEIMNEYMDTVLGALEDKPQRLVYMFKRVRESVKMLIKHLIDEFSQSRFIPDAFELEIGKDVPAYTLNLPNGQRVELVGKVDRADIYEEDGKKYIRIVDYKTGSKKFKLSDVLYGLNLQMLIYLSVITRSTEGKYADGVIPAGILYSPATVSNVTLDKDVSDSQKREKVYGELAMNGLLLQDEQVLAAMERNLEGIYIPVAFSGRKARFSADYLATLEEFGAIFTKIDNIIEEMAMKLKDGVLDAIPMKSDKEDACKYCSYHSICNHREDDPENKLIKLSRDEVIKQLKNEGEEDNNGEKVD